jgi:fumarate reductase flavoprotein subunit
MLTSSQVTGERMDLLVAGAGAAGCAAALAAAEQGLRVTIIDADEQFRTRCNTSRTAAMIPAAGTRWQHAAGIEDTPQRFYDDIMRKTGGQADATVSHALVDVSADLVEWMADACDVPLSLVTEFRYPGHTADRCHTVPDRDGATLHAHLLDAVDDHDRIELLAPATLRSVSTHATGAAAAHITLPDGEQDVLKVRGVVLATNGYAADAELIDLHAPEIAVGIYFGSPFSRGDALRIGRDLGAASAYLDAYQGHGSVAHPHAILLTWATVIHGAVLVNAEGRRFGDEAEGYSGYGARTLAQPGAVAWMVYDARIHDAVRAFANYRALEASGAIAWADDIDELAVTIGASVETLTATLESARAAAEGRRDDPHGRTAWGPAPQPPYAAVRVTGALFHTQGGLRIDGEGRVLRDDGTAITGLYAAGGAAIGISGHGANGYLAGNGLLSALGLGYLAGRAAASGDRDG